MLEEAADDVHPVATVIDHCVPNPPWRCRHADHAHGILLPEANPSTGEFAPHA
jgi:hypothetical protein